MNAKELLLLLKKRKKAKGQDPVKGPFYPPKTKPKYFKGPAYPSKKPSRAVFANRSKRKEGRK
tara:strand:+ start:2021 stop:2209 length:189 start_codon:yes stop_codon:yes gene_type:complete